MSQWVKGEWGGRTVVAQDDAIGGQQLAVQNRLDVGLVAVLVGVYEDEVKVAVKLLEAGEFVSNACPLKSWCYSSSVVVIDVPVTRGTLDQRDSVGHAELDESLLGGGNHLGAQLERDDLGLRVLGALVPSNGAVSTEAANLKN